MANPVMAYAWGACDRISALRGLPPSSGPEAELWMGAHPRAASMLESPDGDERLDTLIAADPLTFVGPSVAKRFGPRLPFMLKVLAAAEPLSLQVHPDDALARERCAAEDSAGIDRDAPDRTYRDPYAKPEALVALSDFQLFLGFRPQAEAISALTKLGIPRLSPVIEALRGGLPTGEAFLRILSWPDDDREPLVSAVRSTCMKLDDDRAPWVAFLADRYPHDPGVVGSVLLNYRRLRPGQAVFVAPGQVHAYIEGLGVEALGASDNVARAGLTPKHVALGELRAMLSVAPCPPEIISPVARADGFEFWPAPRPEFSLARAAVDREPKPLGPGPGIVLCLEGKSEVRAADATIVLSSGESAFITAAGAPATVSGDGVIMRATAGVSDAEA